MIKTEDIKILAKYEKKVFDLVIKVDRHEVKMTENDLNDIIEGIFLGCYAELKKGVN